MYANDRDDYSADRTPTQTHANALWMMLGVFSRTTSQKKNKGKIDTEFRR